MSVTRDVGVVIVAGGSSTRTSGTELKQFRWVAGKPTLLHSLQTFMSRPDVVSVVGFDNWEIIAEATRPRLTTIDMNLKELGHEAGRCLIDLIGGAPLTGLRRMPCSLVVRESCGANVKR